MHDGGKYSFEVGPSIFEGLDRPSLNPLRMIFDALEETMPVETYKGLGVSYVSCFLIYLNYGYWAASKTWSCLFGISSLDRSNYFISPAFYCGILFLLYQCL